MAAVEHPPVPPVSAEASIIDRRKLLLAHGIDLGDLPKGRLGIAFSGGGIRSATISLGVAQALAKQDRLLDFDYMSSVSGGGYFGSFLRSLFLPQAVRGSGAVIDPAGAAMADTRFGLDVLKSDAAATTIPGTPLRNPVRWLRENSRYLAPAGPTDYAVAATYIIRNWVAMLFVFALPVLMFFIIVHGVLRGTAHPGNDFAALGWWSPMPGGLHISPIAVVPALLLVASMVVGTSIWLTVYTTDQASPAGDGGTPLLRVFAAAALAAIAGVAVLSIIGWYWHTGPAAAPLWRLPPDFAVAIIKLLAIGAIAAAAVAAAATVRIAWCEPRIGNDLFGNELRRWLTAGNATINIVLILALALAIIDTLALLVLQNVRRATGPLAFLTVLAPVARWAIQKLQASFGKNAAGGAVVAFLARYLWQVAFVAAVVLWGGFAVLLDVLVRSVAYAPGDWLPAYRLSAGVVALFLIVVGTARGFINLSSLHSFYTARLTRAYLGASNHDRLDRQKLRSITGYQPRDIIRADIYQQQVCASPLHLINVTLNETISASGSQLLERDRKGVPMIVGPEGIWIDAAAAAPASTKSVKPDCSWADYAAKNAEPFSVGQLTAISGAAFSSAMGSRTTLGGALLFTYANIRLGYWWRRGTIGDDPSPTPARPLDWLGWAGTFGYLLREMTARYRSTTARVNLSDGGHFDDSGVYELLRRGVPTIVYCDNGEDAGYRFEDLEIVTRKARLDIGVDVEVASPAHVLAALGIGGARIFLNGQAGDWRARAQARAPADPACALLLLVRDAAANQVGTIVLLKPSLFGTLPADVWGYAQQHPTFPHEATSNQFFTEAQWESYRQLGFMMMQQLLIATPHGADLFRRL